jgi:hypothetical protein
VLNVVAITGPSIGAIVLSIALGRGKLRSLLAGFSVSRSSGRWLAIALALPLAMMAVALAASVAVLGAPRPNLTAALLGLLLVEFVRILFLADRWAKNSAGAASPCRDFRSSTRP